jgi:hypothetical protein
MTDSRLLAKIRKLYGNTHQITVCIEELNELACVLCKYPRYPTHEEALHALKDKVLDEYVDVCIILEHVKAIFGLTDVQINSRYRGKMSRIYRWVHSKNKTPSQTLKDREV